jgi:hypothetical protein
MHENQIGIGTMSEEKVKIFSKYRHTFFVVHSTAHVKHKCFQIVTQVVNFVSFLLI